MLMPSGPSASATALAMHAGAVSELLSPAPFEPSGVSGVAADQQPRQTAPRAPKLTAEEEKLVRSLEAVVPKGVKDSAAAMELVNSMMDPDRQAALTALIPYPPTNKQARLANLPAGLTDYLPATNPTLAETVIVQDQRWWAANEVDVTRRWQELFQG